MAVCKEFADYAANAWLEAADIVRDMCNIPAPSHHEELRAEYCRNWFEKNGFADVTIDKALNVVVPLNVTAGNNVTVIMAHTDTVFPDTEPMGYEEKDGYIYSPGVTDDTANLAVLMVCARYFKDNYQFGDDGFVIVANSCEEGLGNLKGARQIAETFSGRISDFISLDNSSMRGIVTGAVGSHRYKVSVATEGGHSFSRFGNRNAIHVLSSLITSLYTVKVPQNGDSITTYNVGTISGGTSVNTIAQNAEMLYEYRSNDRECLEKMRVMFNSFIEAYRATGVEINVELLGERPCSAEVDQERFAALKKRYMDSLKNVLDLEGSEHFASTDCNIPLSLGIPAICFGVCRGTGAHTRAEKLEVASLQDGCKLLLDFMFR